MRMTDEEIKQAKAKLAKLASEKANLDTARPKLLPEIRTLQAKLTERGAAITKLTKRTNEISDRIFAEFSKCALLLLPHRCSGGGGGLGGAPAFAPRRSSCLCPCPHKLTQRPHDRGGESDGREEGKLAACRVPALLTRLPLRRIPGSVGVAPPGRAWDASSCTPQRSSTLALVLPHPPSFSCSLESLLHRSVGVASIREYEETNVAAAQQAAQRRMQFSSQVCKVAPNSLPIGTDWLRSGLIHLTVSGIVTAPLFVPLFFFFEF
jgi:hypothetical protein